MNIVAKLASIVASCLVLSAASSAQTYRQSFPLGDPTSLDGLSLNLNTLQPTDAQLQQVVDAGFKYVRVDFTWDGIERSKGVYGWAVMDPLMARLQARGLRAMAVLAYSNALYTSTGAPNTPGARAGFAAFAKACAARYARRGVIWEIFNEPNLAGWWPNPNPVDYAALANAATAAIRSASPDEWIVGVSTQTPAGWNNPYIQSTFDNGVLAHGNLDALAFHPYTKAAPETMAKEWDTARTMIAMSAPDGRSVALIAGEAGYSRDWAGFSESLQATYIVRLILSNLAQGLPFTNVFSYSDLPTADDWQAHLGIVAAGTNVPYAAYNAIKRTTTALKGYRFTKRVTLASANDYCLLFSKSTDANDCKLVVWTTDAAHSVSVASSGIPFTSVVLSNGATGSATAVGGVLTMPINREATLFSGTAANPTLGLAAAWGMLPANLTLSTRSDAVSQLGSLIASPAWTSAPAGTTLKIEDVPSAVPGYTRPTYTASLGNLSALTLNSAAVQTVLNSLGGLQDAVNAGRTLKLSLVLPEGNAVVQQAAVVRKQPLSVLATTPGNWALTLRVENPTGAPFNGTLKASAGTVSASVPVGFVQGETYKQINFPTLTSALIVAGVDYDLYDSGGNALDPASPVVDGSGQIVFRASNTVLGAGYSVAMKGVATVAGTATASYSVANWAFLTGAAEMDIDYSFGVGSGKYFMVNGPADLTSQLFAKTPASIGMWVYGDNSLNVLRTQFIDGAGQVFQSAYGAIDWTGWKWVSIPIAGNLASHWGGANDGVVRGKVRCLVPLTVDTNFLGSTGRISISGITIVGQK